MNIWIIYDSKYGNNKQIAQALGDRLAQNHEVHIHYAKKISPKQVAAALPDAFIFGGPRRMGKISYTLRKWVEKFAKKMSVDNIRLKKVAVWDTQGKMDVEDLNSKAKIVQNLVERNRNIGTKWIELLQLFAVEQPAPDRLSIVVEGMEGPLEEKWGEKVVEFADTIENL